MERTVLLGIDGATYSVLDPLMAEGQMDCLRQLIDNGVRGELMSTPHPLTPPAWTTVMTGRMPGSHGIFDFIWAEHRGDTVYFTLNNFRDIKTETIWSMVSRQGGRAISLNYPLMSPPPEINGVIVPGLVSWKHLRRNVHPPQIYPKLQQLPHFNPREIAWDFEREKKATKYVPEQDREEWVAYHVRRELHWFEVFRYLTREEPADLVGILLDGVDKLQHICWKYLDPACFPSEPTETDLKLRELCREYFRNLDRFIGQACEWAGDDGRVIIVSDHGFCRTDKVFRVNKWLEQKGYLTFARTDHLTDEDLKKVDRLTSDHFVHLDWSRTKAYAQSAATNGIDIRISREPGDGGAPASEYPRFREQLMNELLAVRDPETHTPIVTNILRREEAFAGANNRRCPDLTLVLHDYGFVSTLNKDPIFYTRPEVAGTHHPAGVVMACGAGIARGRDIGKQSIVDVAPTVLYSLGLPVPLDLEGAVMREAFDEVLLARRPIQTGDHAAELEEVDMAVAEPNAEEQEIILERLRALGYVE